MPCKPKVTARRGEGRDRNLGRGPAGDVLHGQACPGVPEGREELAARPGCFSTGGCLWGVRVGVLLCVWGREAQRGLEAATTPPASEPTTCSWPTRVRERGKRGGPGAAQLQLVPLPTLPEPQLPADSSAPAPCSQVASMGTHRAPSSFPLGMQPDALPPVCTASLAHVTVAKGVSRSRSQAPGLCVCTRVAPRVCVSV